MSQLDKDAIKHFSLGPEMDITPHVQDSIAAIMDNLPREFQALLEELGESHDQHDVRVAMEVLLEGAIKEGIEIGKGAATYADNYQKYGWQYDETPLELTPEANRAIERSTYRRAALAMGGLVAKRQLKQS